MRILDNTLPSKQFTVIQRGLLFRTAIAEGTRLFPKRTLIHLYFLYLTPERKSGKWQLSGCVGSRSIEYAMRVIARLLSSDRLGVGRPMI